MVSKNVIYSCNNQSVKGENIKLLEKAGLLEHENCIPYLAKSKGSWTNKSKAELRKLEVLDDNLNFRKEDKKSQEASCNKKNKEGIENIGEHTKPLFLELKRKFTSL